MGELFERLNPRLDTVRAFCEIESLQKEIKLKRQERIQLRVKIGRAQAVDRVVDAQEQIAQCEKSLETLTEEFINSMSRLRLVLEREGREE